MDGRTVGVLGGGQLGRMMCEAALRLGVKVAILDPGMILSIPLLVHFRCFLIGGSLSPAGQVATLSVEGSFQDAGKIKELSAISDIVTTEIEHVNTDILLDLEKNGATVRPNAETIRSIQDKYIQKQLLSAAGVSVPDFIEISSIEAAEDAGLRFGYPLMLKNRKFAYDGKGNAVAKNESEVADAYNKLGTHDIYAEKWVPFVKEIAVMVVRTVSGKVLTYPVVETIQENSICHLVIAPAQISQAAETAAKEVAVKAIESFDGIGIYGVELFLLSDDTVLLNEIAPRYVLSFFPWCFFYIFALWTDLIILVIIL
jgi:phosphoribosylaminoimidazole carboxylase